MSLSNAIIVTGGAGFIGSNFVLDWVASGLGRVVNLDKLTYAGNAGNLAKLAASPDHLLVRGDICDETLVSGLFQEHRPMALVHFAAESHVDRSIDSPEVFVRTNVNGTYCLLEAARRYFAGLTTQEREKFRFLHVSTDEVYGTLAQADPAFAETTAYRPNSPYAASKASSDHLVRAWHHTFGLPTLITNCSNNYGPYQFPEKLIPLVITSALAGRSLPIYGDGQQIRDWLYVGDHCAALRRVIKAGRPGETYNVGGGNQCTNLDVVQTVCRLLDQLQPRATPYADLIKFVSDRPGHDRRYAINHQKLSHELDWLATESFETGLRKTVSWYLANGDWMLNVTSGAYLSWFEQNYDKREIFSLGGEK